jgi:hypothetical protein
MSTISGKYGANDVNYLVGIHKTKSISGQLVLQLFRIMSIVLTSEQIGRRLPVFTLLL